MSLFIWTRNMGFVYLLGNSVVRVGIDFKPSFIKNSQGVVIYTGPFVACPGFSEWDAVWD